MATKTAQGNPDDDRDLMGEIGDGEDVDLLDDVVEDDAEGWVPSEAGEGVQGTVVIVSRVKSDFDVPGTDDNMVPSVTIQQKDGTKVRVIGYGKVLREKITEDDPKPGDLYAVKYFGEKTIKNGKYAGKPYKLFNTAIRRN